MHVRVIKLAVYRRQIDADEGPKYLDIHGHIFLNSRAKTYTLCKVHVGVRTRIRLVN